MRSLGWTPPASDGGAPITGYRITPYIGGDRADPDRHRRGDDELHVTGLTNGTAYTFRVAAINAVGTGTASAPRRQ